MFLLLGLAFFLPVSKTIAPFFVLFLIVEWVFSKRWKSPLFDKTYLGFFALYYFYLLFSLTWTDNMTYGWQDLGSKTTFFFMPLLLGTKDEKLNYYKILEWFLYGTIVILFWNYGQSFSEYLKSGNINYFYYSTLSPQFHVAYASMYAVFGIAIAYFFYANRYKYFKSIWITSGIVLLQSIHVVMLNSKACFIAMLVVYFIIFIWFLKTNMFKSFILPAIGILVISLGILFSADFLFQRFFGGFEVFKPKEERVISAQIEDVDGGTESPAKSSEIRVIAWTTALEIIKKNPFGVGVGDRKDVFISRLSQKGHHRFKEKGLNTHNQYLQVLLAIGIPGLMIFLINLFYPVVEAFKKRNFLILSFIACISVNMLFESMLEVQAGIIFYTFFAVLLVRQMRDKKSYFSRTVNT